MELVIGLLLPFLGTSFGAMMVLFMRNKINEKVEKILLGFAAGVMMAASVWSLLIPSIEESASLGKLSFLPAAVGFLLGVLFLLALDTLIPHWHLHATKGEGLPSKIKKTTKLIFSVTLHNIPEGMAIGIVFANALYADQSMTLSQALILSIGIAIQNFPEGAIVSMPLKQEGISKPRAFLYGALSGIVEPIAAVLTILLTKYITPVLPYLLSFAAGAMIYVIVEEVIPDSQDGPHSNLGTIGVAIGFALMMILDVALG
ncbi:MAG TPA: ZIP family metal transporter [Candidatus Pelethenecus faecipullorum]|mgnify:CR=1 FL=1|uniref:ZIP family metal transporter n=1 Tax=Candidatus Pelethenecus faecipullorum TaxID=2840900 RepID=A0A9D1GRR0_9MOLU|nr:ZIP family metal transporter [Candidatus Pelethenecus faecipullorum]